MSVYHSRLQFSQALRDAWKLLKEKCALWWSQLFWQSAGDAGVSLEDILPAPGLILINTETLYIIIINQSTLCTFLFSLTSY